MNLLLRYWLSLTGVDPDRDVETVVVPPEQVVPALAGGQIAGFCAAAPWGLAAELEQVGCVLLGSWDIWPFHPEKCLAVRDEWAPPIPKTLTRMLRVLMRAQVICDRPEEAAAGMEDLYGARIIRNIAVPQTGLSEIELAVTEPGSSP
jgi:NitT/TauT family transport system ATP-binding protein/nitrate/nitrite transport system substrate-binding protein